MGGDPRPKADVEDHFALTERDQRDGERRRTLAAGRQHGAQAHAQQTTDHRWAMPHAIDQSGDERRQQARELGDGQGHADLL